MKCTLQRASGFTKFLLGGLAVLAVAGTSSAADGNWTSPSSGTWSTPANWAGETIAAGAGATASFNNGTSLSVSQDIVGLTLGSLFFASADYTVTDGAIALDNNGGPAVVTVGTGSLATLDVPLNGAGGLTKTGPGTLTLFVTNSYLGATAVMDGMLKLGNRRLPVMAGLAYRLDASVAASVTRSGDHVTSWADADGGDVTFSQGDAGQQPVYVANAFNGRAAVRFSESARNRMVANRATTAQTVFIVNRMTAYGSIDGIWGQDGNDKGIRARGPTQWSHAGSGGDMNDFTYLNEMPGQMYINGVDGSTFAFRLPHILTAVSPSAVSWTAVIGDYWGSSEYYRFFRGEIGEVLVYDRVLSTGERQAVEAYLAHKWLGSEASAFNVLPSATALALSGGAAIDLNGMDQTVGSLSGEGPVRNGNAGSCMLTVGGDDTTTLFNGDIQDAVALTKTGAGTLTLSGACSYLGATTVMGGMLKLGSALPSTTALAFAGGAAIDLNGVNQTVGSLSGKGSVRNGNAGSCTLTVGGDNTSTLFNGGIQDAITLTKTGTGTLTLSGTNSYRGATTVMGGVLKLGNGPSVTAGLCYRLDASDAATLTRSGDNVTGWTDANGSDVAFSQSDAGQQPVYMASAINGRPAVRFSDTASNRMFANRSTTAQTVFIVCRMTSFGAIDGIWGQSGGDAGIRAESLTQWKHVAGTANANDFSYTGQMYINGEAGSVFAALQPHVLTAVSPYAVSWNTAIGNYWNEGPGVSRYFRGEIGEVLVYDRALSTDERQAVEAYLSHKWLGDGPYPSNVLPPATALAVSGGAAIDLNGVDQTVGSLSGEGPVRNGNPDGCTLTVGGDDSSTLFNGGIQGSVTLTKIGAGTLTLYGTNSVTGKTVVQSGVLKLGGWPVTSGLSYRLDATDAATLTRSGDNVMAWAAVNGNGVTFITQGDAGRQPPVYVASAINGLPAIRFGDAGSTRMVANQDKTVQTVFIVCRMTSADGANGIWGHAGYDKGIRASNVTSWLHTSSGGNGDDFSYNGQMYINGVEGTSFTALQPHILTAVATSSASWQTAIGDYWGSAQYNTRHFHGEIGEVLVYDRVLSTVERQTVEAQLSHKWLGTSLPPRLEAYATVAVAAGATLDLGGQAQTLAGLSGGGSVIGGSLAVSGQTVPGEEGAVGTLSLPPATALSGTLLIDVHPDGTCDKLTVAGDLDISGLGLVIADTGLLGTSVYTIATCAGAMTGSFTGNNLPEKLWAVRYDRTPGAGRILLVPARGTLIILR